MATVDIILGTTSYTYQHGHPVLELPVIRKMIEFEGNKDRYQIQIPDDFIDRWQQYEKYLLQRKDSSLDESFVDLAKYVMDEETVITLSPELFNYSQLFNFFKTQEWSPSLIRCLRVAYNLNKKDMVLHSLKNKDWFCNLLEYELQLLEQSDNSDHPILNHFISFLQECTDHRLLKKRKNEIISSPLASMIVLYFNPCDCSFPLCKNCESDLHTYKFSQNHNYIIGKELNFNISGIFKLRPDLCRYDDDILYYEYEGSWLKIVPWISD